MQTPWRPALAHLATAAVVAALLPAPGARGQSSPAAAPASASVVRPGKGVGPVRIGMTHDALVKALGKPSSSGAAGPYRQDLFRWAPGGGPAPIEPTLTVVSRGGRVVQVSVHHSSCRTPEGVTPESTFATIRKRYPRLSVRGYVMPDPSGGGYVLLVFDDVKRGVAFTTSTQDDEGTYQTLPESCPYDVTVHAPGMRAVAIDAVTGVVGKPSRPFKDSFLPRIQAYMNGAPHKPRR